MRDTTPQAPQRHADRFRYSDAPGERPSFSRQGAKPAKTPEVLFSKANTDMARHLDDVARHIVDCALRVHIQTGPGLLESVYEVLLARQLQKRGLEVQRQLYTDVIVDGVSFDGAFRLDMLVERAVAVEIKSVEAWNAAHWKQLLTYLRLMDLRLGFLLNFGGATMKGNIKRVANRYNEIAS